MGNLSNNMVLSRRFLFESYADYGKLSQYIEGYTRVSKWVNGWWQPFGKLRIIKSGIFFGFDWVYLSGEDKEDHSLLRECIESLDQHLMFFGGRGQLRKAFKGVMVQIN